MRTNDEPKRLRIPARLLIVALLICVPAITPLVARAASESPASDDAMATTENSLEFLGTQRRMLKTFVDPDAALAKFKETYPEFLQDAKDAGLPELSKDTAYAYKVYSISSEAEGDIIDFLDIYENEASNEARTTEIKTIEGECAAGDLTQEEANESASTFLPLTSESDSETLSSARAAFNLSNAQSYASEYAVNPNSTFGVETAWGLEADCTNFASQILYAGGIQMDSNASIYSGGWWRSRGSGNQSITWIQAAAFTRYMGSGYNSTSWSNLVSNVTSGDFIGFDKNNDGDIDHIGFAHTKNYGTVKIAQHSTNYIKWAAQTGWPSMENGTTRFYRIRR